MNNEDPNYAFSEEWHKDMCPNHSGKQGHYCLEWDDMYICEDCEEFKYCECGYFQNGKHHN